MRLSLWIVIKLIILTSQSALLVQRINIRACIETRVREFDNPQTFLEFVDRFLYDEEPKLSAAHHFVGFSGVSNSSRQKPSP